MKTIRQKTYGGIPITLKKSKRARKISLRINEQAIVSVSMPYRMSYNTAQLFINKHYDWILRHYKARKKNLEKNTTRFTIPCHYKTEKHIIEIINNGHKKNLSTQIYPGKVIIHVPEEMPVEAIKTQEYIRDTIIETYRREAKEILPERVKQLAALTGLAYNRVFIKNNKTRWGSCSVKNNINLNLHMMRLPAHLRDYIIIHELAHTKHKNHGEIFWKTVDNLCGNARSLSKELKNYSLQVF